LQELAAIETARFHKILPDAFTGNINETAIQSESVLLGWIGLDLRFDNIHGQVYSFLSQRY
jgi:hypothetical protein